MIGNTPEHIEWRYDDDSQPFARSLSRWFSSSSRQAACTQSR
jgi:hypothetical protein